MQPTHLLLSKLDEVPDDTGIADLAALLALPARWLTDGLDVPADLKPAPQRILAALGRMAGQVAS
jgi:flagellar biosynthesis protein FlhF